MNIFNDIIRGASTQFGREFGRAGANAVLKGKNYYSVQNSGDYSGRIKPSDSEIIRTIKEINKIKFVTTDKANTSRLIELTDLASEQIIFIGTDTLNEISDIKKLIDDYNDKFEHGSILISDDFKDKSLDYLKEKRQKFIYLLEEFNIDSKAHIKKHLETAIRNKKSKTTATILSCPFLIIGALGFHKFYLKEYGYGILYILLSSVFISAIFSLVNFIQLLTMSDYKFNNKYNPIFSYYNQFQSNE
jgi:TM2 domain-containing membrane protein YozV